MSNAAKVKANMALRPFDPFPIRMLPSNRLRPPLHHRLYDFNLFPFDRRQSSSISWLAGRRWARGGPPVAVHYRIWEYWQIHFGDVRNAGTELDLYIF
jgi:hypothetical protein